MVDGNFLSAKAVREGTPPKAVAAEEIPAGDCVKVHGEPVHSGSECGGDGGAAEDGPKPKVKKRIIIRRIVRKKKVLPKKDEKFCECSSCVGKDVANCELATTKLDFLFRTNLRR